MSLESQSQKVQANAEHQQDITSLMNKLSMDRRIPFVLSGCSGAGKGTLIKYLLSKYPDEFELSVSYTTRKPRAGQQHGREYYFVTFDEFQSEIQNGVFQESGLIHENYYGTHKGEVERIRAKGKICILQIDLVAAEKIYANNPDYNYLFLNVPDIEVLRERMRKRGTETEQKIEMRMNHAKKQMQKIKQLSFYDHISNQDLEQTKIDLIDYLNKNYQLNLVP